MFADAWSAHADTYERYFEPLTSQLSAGLFRLANQEISTARAVLDVACGCGALTLPLAQWAREVGARVEAIDASSRMIERTQARLRSADLASSATCQVGDGQDLPYSDASFDAVFSSFGIFLFPERQAGWREAGRVLRPGGLFATTVWRGPAHNDMARAQMQPLMRALPERLLSRPSRSWLDIADAPALRAEVAREVGIGDLRVYVLNASLVLPSPRIAWRAMRDNPVTGTLLGACNPKELRAVEETFVQSLSERSGGPDRPLVLDASCHALLGRKLGT